MGDRIATTLRGWGILPPNYGVLRLAEDESTYTESSPRPGTSSSETPSARSAPQVLLAQAQPVTIRGSHAGGFPGVNEDGGAVGYYLHAANPAETADDMRHWRPPWVLTAALNFGQARESVYVDMVAFPLSGKVLLAYPQDSGGGDLTYTYDPLLNTWTINAAGPLDHGALVVLPGTAEDVLWISEEGQAQRSTDYGATWALHARFAPLIAADGSYTYAGAKRRAVVDGAGNLLFCGKRSTGNEWDFHASSDLGHTWSTTKAQFAAKDVDLVATRDGSIVVVLVRTDDELEARVIGGAYTDPSNADALAIEDTQTWVEATISCDDDGALYVIGRRAPAGGATLQGFVSNDGGNTFLKANGSTGTPMIKAMGTSLDYPKGARAVHTGGRLFFAHGNDAGANQYFNAVAIFGGWQGPYYERIAGNFSATYPPREIVERFYLGQDLFNLNWWCAATPESIGGSGWNATTTGSPTAALGNGGLQVTVASTEEYYWDDTITTGGTDAAADDAWLRFAARVDNDNGGDDNIRVTVRTAGHEFSVVLHEDGWKIHDEDAAADIGAEVAVSEDTVIYFELYVDDSTGVVTVLHAEAATGKPFPTKYTKTQRLLTGSSSNGSERLRWGCIGAASGALDATFYFVAFASSFRDGTNAPPTLLEGDDGWGKAVGSEHGYPIPELGDSAAGRQALLTMHGGPITAGDTYTHDTAPDYPIEHLFPTESPGPDSRWRSVDKSADVEVAWDLGAINTLPAGSFSWAILAQKSNVRRITISGKAAGVGTYTTLGTLDLATGFVGVDFERTGRILRPGAGYTGVEGSRYIWPGEYRGGHVVLDVGGTPTYHRVLFNTGGRWGDASVQPTLVLDGITGTEATTGTCHLVSPSGVLVLHWDSTAAIPTRYLKATIDASADGAPDDYYELGTLAPFGIRVPGKPWHHGWEWDRSPNFQATSDTRRTERRTSLGPPQRKLTKSWDHGVLVERLRGLSDPDYLGRPSRAALVSQDEVWGELWELLDLTDSAARPLLYLGQIGAHQTTLTDPTLFMLAYLGGGGIRAQNSAGSEGVDEFVRNGPITLTEVVG